MAGKEASSSSEEVMPLRSVPEGFEMRRRASMRSVKSGRSAKSTSPRKDLSGHAD